MPIEFESTQLSIRHVCLLQVLQNVNSATDAAESSCLTKPDLLSCRAVPPGVAELLKTETD
jgi:hypothetical protein